VKLCLWLEMLMERPIRSLQAQDAAARWLSGEELSGSARLEAPRHSPSPVIASDRRERGNPCEGSAPRELPRLRRPWLPMDRHVGLRPPRDDEGEDGAPPQSHGQRPLTALWTAAFPSVACSDEGGKRWLAMVERWPLTMPLTCREALSW